MPNSFTRAAEGLFLTQSAVSHQIAKLEAAVNCELLTRQRRAVSLTPAGREMAHQARRVLAAVDEAEARVMAKRLAKEEGIFAGTSTALNVVAALKLAKELGAGKVVATVAVDTGLKYLAGDLFSV